MAYIMALIMMAVFSTLAVAFAMTADTNVQKSANIRNLNAALLEAESGHAVMRYMLNNCRVPLSASGQMLLDWTSTSLSGMLTGTGNLQGSSLSYDSATVSVPTITCGNGRNFSALLSLADTQLVHLRVTGRQGNVTRQIGMDYEMSPARHTVFDYGVATRGTVIMSGNAKILAANPGSTDADMISAYDGGEKPAFDLSGNAVLEGDISTTATDATVTVNDDFSGSVTKGVGDVEFPEIDTSCFDPFATNLVTTGSTGPGQTFTNIRIVAGTNPTFDAETTLLGVTYIEAPNQVTFAGKATIRGVIVTEDAGDDVYDENWIHFSGQVESYGVDTLPDTPEFEGLRDLTGTFLLAPGFNVDFSGQFGTINGAMGAEKFTFSGQATGNISGTIVSYGDVDFVPSGQATLTIDRSGSSGTPPGFDIRGRFYPVPDSYKEY